MKNYLLYCVCAVSLFSIVGCGGSSAKRGRKDRQETEGTRTKEAGTMADKYARIDKACNRLEVIVDTVSINNHAELNLIRTEINGLRIEAKDIASDYEAKKLSGEVHKQLIDAGVDYALITKLSFRTEELNSKFVQKFGDN